MNCQGSVKRYIRLTEIAIVSSFSSDAHDMEMTMKKRVNMEGRITTLAWLARILSSIQLETKGTGIIGEDGVYAECAALMEMIMDLHSVAQLWQTLRDSPASA
jgi:hypothetical protein